MGKNFQRATAFAAVLIMVVTMSVPAFAAEGDILTDGSAATNDNFSANISSHRDRGDKRPDGNQSKPDTSHKEEIHEVSYYLRTNDKGTLSFTSATVKDRSSIGSACVPDVTLSGNWYLDGYYVDGIRYTAAELAGYKVTSRTLQIEVRTYPDSDRNGRDDRKETYTVTFNIRRGDNGELAFDSSTITGSNDTLGASNVPLLTDRSSKTYSISGYYVDGRKYSRAEMGRLQICEDTDVEVRTYRNNNSSSSSSDESVRGYDWKQDTGLAHTYSYRPCGCIYDCAHTYNPYNTNPFYFGANPYYPYPPYAAYPYPVSGYGPYYGGPCYTAPYVGQYTVQCIPQNGAAASYLGVIPGGRLTPPANPTCSGYTFLGWSTSKNGNTGYWNFNNPIAGNLTLYGIWTKNAPAAR